MSNDFFLIAQGGLHPVRPDEETLAELRDDPLEIVMFNVGDGEAIIIRRRRLAILVDGGSVVKKRNRELGRVLLSYLSDEGLRLRAIVASHPHTDHLKPSRLSSRKVAGPCSAPAPSSTITTSPTASG